MEEPVRKGLGKEAWTAIGSIGAALVTGAITLLVYVIPPSDNSSDPLPAGAVSTRSSTAGEALPAETSENSPVAALLGKWSGTARTSDGAQYRITLTIDRACTAGQRCGRIGISSVPCYGEVFLEAENDGDVEFTVAHFDKRSDHDICRAGAGEHFRLRTDGKLNYRTSYEPIAQGILLPGIPGP